MTHEIARFKPAHGSPKPQYLRGIGDRTNNPKKRLFNPFASPVDTRLATRNDTRRCVSQHRQFPPIANILAGTNWHMVTLAEKKEKTPAGEAPEQSFHLSSLFAPRQPRNRVKSSDTASLSGTAYSLIIPFFTLQNAAL